MVHEVVQVPISDYLTMTFEIRVTAGVRPKRTQLMPEPTSATLPTSRAMVVMTIEAQRSVGRRGRAASRVARSWTTDAQLEIAALDSRIRPTGRARL
jgi:hypothetical protein